ncbi:hypothetical protein HWV62_34965 [Athelia sp. TMB]|nr:hypothetical protein HWV62_34965 [Athelia sp. TMB]
MPKRLLDETTTSPKAKKAKITDESKARKENHIEPLPPSKLTAEEIDFPRGGGSSFTPIEVKAIRAEALQEADDELFEESKKSKPKKKKIGKNGTSGTAAQEKKDQIRVEHLNYKRLIVGTKLLGQVVSVQPLALIISLPNQLLGHVPITQISTHLTRLLEAMDEDEDESEEEEGEGAAQKRVPDLSDLYRPGQYVRTVVTAVHAAGSTDASGIGNTRDLASRGSRRVELSLSPDQVNDGVQKTDLVAGFVSHKTHSLFSPVILQYHKTLSAAVKSIEDHGYILDMGLSDVSGFMSFKDAKKGPFGTENKLHLGGLVDVTVLKMSGNGRTCTLSPDTTLFTSSAISEVTNVSSILPGALVQSLITAVVPSGLNLQILGFFEGTVDQISLRTGKTYKVGQKIKARVLYDVPATSPPKFALTLAEHVIGLEAKHTKGAGGKDRVTLQEGYPIGTIFEEAKVASVEQERGLMIEVEPGVQGFVHISHTSDDHIPSLSSTSGAWKVDSLHRARVTGYFPFDGLLQLSLRPTILAQSYLQVDDVQVGEVIKGTIKKLTDTALFVTISGSIDGAVWPNHYADITLKHPSKRFKPGAQIKCRVLTVDPERKRVALTAKKSLIESSLPIITKFKEATVGMITHAVVFRITEKGLQVEFYNGLKAFVPTREANSDAVTGKLTDAFPIGKVVKVRIINLNPETSNIVASIKQAAVNFKSTITDISGVEIGNTVEGVVSEIHKDNAVLSLKPTQVRALVSLTNLANHRGTTVSQLRLVLKAGDQLERLFVVSRNAEKGFVVVACKPRDKIAMLSKAPLTVESVQVGQIVGGRVTRHDRNGAHVKLTTRIAGSLHPTDACDDYAAGLPFPAIDSIIKAVVVDVDRDKRYLSLSTRPSKLYPEQIKPVVDKIVGSVAELRVGESIRGFIKTVADHGLFVTLGRDVDARVQIRELFDEANQLVKGRILSVDAETKKVEMTFRSGDLNRVKSTSLSFADLLVDQVIDGRVKKVEDYGLFIEIEGSKLSGLCHKSELSDNKDADVAIALRNFREGDHVKAIVLSIDKEKRRLSLGLKPSYFVNQDFEGSEGSFDQGSNDEENFGVAQEDQEDGDVSMGPVEEAEKSNVAVDNEEDEVMFADPDLQAHPFSHEYKTGTEVPAPPLEVAGGFQWSGTNDAADHSTLPSSSDESDDAQPTTKKKKRTRKMIEQDLTADMHTKTPESNADFERLLLGSPNSSYLWVQFMSFQLQLSEVEKAREIGRRALKAINFREEQEKMNVWIALLNLENVYGNDETMEAIFKEAARHNDSKTVHLRLASIYDQTEKYHKAEEQYKRTVKKFGQSSKVWTLFAEHYLRQGEVEEARKLLPRSLQSLEKRKHLKTISKFAQIEYKLGDPERGKTVFEGIIDSHPKRWDLWSIYMDMEAGQRDIQSLRSFFKKWLDIERRLGDDEGAALVKQKAIEWTQKAVAP